MRYLTLSLITLFANASIGAPTVLSAQTSAGAAGTDTVCDWQASFDACISRLMNEAAAAAGQQTEDATKRQLAEVAEKVEEQATPATNPGSSTSLLDLLSPLAGALGFDGVSDPAGNFAFDRVLRLGHAARLKLGGTVFGDAELFEALQEKLLTEAPEGTAGEFENDVGDFDKVDFEAVLSREGTIVGRYYGRTPKTYEPFLRRWQQEAMSAVTPPFTTWQQSPPVGDAVARHQRSTGGDADAPGFFTVPIEDLEEPLGVEAVRRLDESLRDLAERHAEFIQAVDLRDEIELLDELIANQPQLLLEGAYRERRHLTGPDEWTAEASYEIGLSGNVNDFLTWAGKPANRTGECDLLPNDVPNLKCLEGYLASEPRLRLQRATDEEDKAEHGPRLKVAVQYTKTNPLRLALPDAGFEFDLDATQAWTGSLTYGRYLSAIRLPHLPGLTALADVDEGQLARFDLEVKYDEVTGDPDRQSRLVATATLSQKTSDNSVASLSLVWAEKPEYLGEVDENVSANLGIKWQLDPAKD